MATTESSSLHVQAREPEGSRAARRLRRSGKVPGVLYGGADEPVSFSIDARILRNTLAHAGAVLQLDVEGSGGTPVMVKELIRHPVTGDAVHIDLLRVRMDEKIQSTVLIDLVGVENAPGVRDGGVLEQVARELTIEALPGDIPDSIQHDASTLESGGTLTLAELRPPSGVVFVDDPETVVASITATRLQLEDDNEIEQETEVIGEATPAAEDEPGDEDPSANAPADTTEQ
jgi:large subunit ribosomal protein L25